MLFEIGITLMKTLQDLLYYVKNGNYFSFLFYILAKCLINYMNITIFSGNITGHKCIVFYNNNTTK